MRRALSLIGCIALLLTLAAPALAAVQGVSHSSGPEADVKAVKAAFDNILAASNNRDEATLDLLFSPDLTVIDSHGLTRGWDTYKATALDSQYARVAESTEPHVVSDTSVAVNGDTAWVTYQFTTSADTNGVTETYFGYGTVILTRNALGEWIAEHMQSNARALRDGETVP